ncbi:MAG: class I SAM-dependent methyltransferase [Euryarchaeota archaeon]|nr:class I SAM-dependent methyltransferase [Euryarchaeota archaeon]
MEEDLVMCMIGIWQTVDKLIRKSGPYVPFYLENTVLRSIGGAGQSILDVGCGWGEPMEIMQLNKHKFYTVGVDIFKPYLKEAKKNKTHSEYVLCDIRNLPFKENTFETVLCTEVIEHLDKDDAMKLIKEMEKIAQKQVIITTPVGFWQDAGKDGNPYQVHRSGFYPIEFKKLGYNTRAFGIRLNPITFSHTHLKIVRRVLRVIFSPFSYYFPDFGERMVCIKKM